MPLSQAAPGPAEPSVEQLAAFVCCYPRLFVLTGAGVSTDSGLPDYRDHEGAWKRSPPMRFQEFVTSQASRRRYWARSFAGWPSVAQARPGPAHKALTAVQARGYIDTLVTQNVDGLHQRAGSLDVTDLHGRIDRVVCLQCQQTSKRGELQTRLADLNPDWRTLSAGLAPDGDADLGADYYASFRLAECLACGGALKPDVVFFGEAVPAAQVDQAFAKLARADAVLVVGSSLMIFSGFRFVRAAVHAGKPVAALNLGRTRADDLLTLKLQQPCGPTLQALSSLLPA